MYAFLFTKFTAIQSYFDGFLHLLFPSTCVICQTELLNQEKFCCSVCYSELSYSYYEMATEPTELDQLFWGRANISSTYSLFFYNKNNNIKPLLQALKYKNRPDIGIELGKMLGEKLKSNYSFETVDILIPVPLHYKKKYIRGYNQSEKIAVGITLNWDKRVDIKSIIKERHTKSQTTFGRFKRWDNVQDMFTVNESIKNYKHIAIVDDVITTGSTLESMIQSIRQISPDIKISVISLAVAK